MKQESGTEDCSTCQPVSAFILVFVSVEVTCVYIHVSLNLGNMRIMYHLTFPKETFVYN